MTEEDTPLDNPITDPPAEAVEELTEPETDNPPEEPARDLFETILGRLDEIATAITSNTPETTQPELPNDPPNEPGHGEEVEDTTPVKKPWTHRRLFG